ncbi:MAG: hypothetical protein A3A80_01360 [Candidatus Terrybacteria bacterium RIFCSPLOWO2_01_FULL_44_24]|uniref:Uncharacterized protein n=1 Tax=Candidatus Terrybacteria bacterium RIFCSPHIGHO2_01_FULL_43_35 TaxID=1802361 RepID=A0A1G2PFD5_9BACT|nr:MAG: hypothetical protein A2828_03735 [Candidatus Terrybacteria bacterium RIFCSPHIGHO2_01_FULL_43_35]OHA49948.1 MAG: hypothetical protein A3B75_03565 [Candidatus Terrybacteria bacterium RIFCSPHIGHO2_02_FULL_43_14]OHA51730.1 MAG: hypothetical protein A3A80_01360 [Candidatus Terrybacteria bacterium RIFCSPLOWO2_01_FULL_44_24]
MENLKFWFIAIDDHLLFYFFIYTGGRLTLSLFVLRIFADNGNPSASSDYLTIPTHFFNRGPNFHKIKTCDAKFTRDKQSCREKN